MSVAVIGLAWDDYDIQRADLDIHFEITEGMDELPETRGSDEVIPFRRGRLAQERMGDRRVLVATGWISGPATAQAAVAYREYVDRLKQRLDPTSRPRILVATMENGLQRFAYAVPRNLIGGPGIGSDFRPFSIEWEALDPYWYGTWGTLTLDTMDAGYLLDTGLFLDSSAEVVASGTDATFNTLGSAPVTKVRVRFVGPSVGEVGIETAGSAPVGFRIARTLTASDSIEVDNEAGTVMFSTVPLNIPAINPNLTSVRNLMTLNAANQHGEYLRLPAGEVTLRIIGSPAQTRILFNPTFQ